MADDFNQPALVPPITVRRMTSADWPTLRALRLTALAEAPTAFYASLAVEAGMSEEQWRARAAEWSGGAGFMTFLAFDAAGAACGIAAGVRDREDSGVAVLISMWVAWATRRLGVGRELVGRVLGWARANGYGALDFEVTETNARARGFYEALGFVATGRNSRHPHFPELTMLGMTMSLRTRLLRAEEWELFRELRIASIRDTPKAFGMSLAEAMGLSDEEWRERTVARTMAEKAITVLGVDAEGAAVGIASGVLDEKEGGVAKLLSMWVAPEHRRAGMARAIVEEVLGWARGRGLGAVMLVVTEGNAGAIRLYERLGFGFTGNDEPSRSHPPLRMLEMRVAL